MIEKMKFLSITGHKDDMDRVIDQYLSKYEMQYGERSVRIKNRIQLKTIYGDQPL